MTELLSLLAALGNVPVISILIISGLSISTYAGARHLLRRYVNSSFHATSEVLTGVVNQHEGILAEHQHRLEVLRGDVRWTEERVRKLFLLVDELRGRR